jgi:hypothetical protein
MLQRDQLGVTATGEAARGRARRGDCKGALPAFDDAIERTIEPTLRRDRGICHEKLGNVFPAIDDFRAYLTAMPDAPDAESVRLRLTKLEEDAGVGGFDPEKKDGEKPPPRHALSDSDGASASVSVDVDPKSGRKVDSVKAEEADVTTPLRFGKGWVLAPYFGVHKWFGEGVAFGTTSSWAETVGGRLAYSFGTTSSLLIEVGYERFNTTSADPFSLSGLSSLVGYEARFTLSKTNPDNLFLLGIALGWEYLILSSNGVQTVSAAKYGAIVPRGRLGFRHNFGPSAAFEVSADGGAARFFLVEADGNGSTAGLASLNLALLFAL